MRLLFFTLMVTFVGLNTASAAERSFVKVKATEFKTLRPSDLKLDQIQYTQLIGSFSDWSKYYPEDQKNLGLYPGYIEPTVEISKGGVRSLAVEKLMMFESRSKTLLNLPAAQIQLAKFLSLKDIEQFDSEIQHRQIHDSDLMLNRVLHPPVTNFQWCNQEGPFITRPARETNLSYTQNPQAPWVCDGPKSMCVESCFVFGSAWRKGVYAVNLLFSEPEKKDYGIAMQSQLKYFTNEADLGLSSPLKDLTGIDTPVRGGLVQNIFYANQVMEFGKVLVILQDGPTPNTTAMTAFFVVGLKKRTYDTFFEVPHILNGTSSFNTKTGITAGFPVFTLNTVKSIANLMEH